MELKDVLQGFRQRLLCGEHLTPLYKEKDFSIVIDVSDCCYMIELSNDCVDIRINNEVENADLFIEGQKNALIQLINGAKRLQRLQKQEDIRLKGTYSAVLKAETIFYLNH